MEIIIFTSPTCLQCDAVKKRIPERLKQYIRYYDATDPKNEQTILICNAYYSVHKDLPVMNVDDENYVGMYAVLKKLNALAGEFIE